MSDAVDSAAAVPAGAAEVDTSKRNALIATGVVGGLGVCGVAVPFVSTFAPSERARAAGGPVEVDISALRPGEMQLTEWRGNPVWILKRTPEMMQSLAKTEGEVADPKSERYYQLPTPDYAANQHRSREDKKDVLIAVGICSHLGCSPSRKFEPGDPSVPATNWQGGFLCPCHGSTFDLAGRVYKNKPAPVNLDVPRHMYLSDTKIVIGRDEKGEA
jgi:ubiquinol-cytochrome c reductase iron-sulfur subunit